MKIIPQEKWIQFSHQLIWHGRRVCFARKPNAYECKWSRFATRKTKRSEDQLQQQKANDCAVQQRARKRWRPQTLSRLLDWSLIRALGCELGGCELRAVWPGGSWPWGAAPAGATISLKFAGCRYAHLSLIVDSHLGQDVESFPPAGWRFCTTHVPSRYFPNCRQPAFPLPEVRRSWPEYHSRAPDSH